MTVKLEVKNLYKIFGNNPEPAFKLLATGLSKEQILEKTGLTVGVQDVNLAIEEGEIFVIMGLSGSGKSTLVRLLNRLIEPTKGHVLIDNEDISTITETQLRDVRRSKISMVFQSFALMPHLNILENTAFGMELAGVPKEERHQKALETLQQVNLENYALSYPDELSGGMQQRVGLARALANNPDILLMDEAFSALDPLIRAEMQDELLRLQGEHQRTVVFISHDLDEAMRIGDRIAIMQDGIVVQVGTPDEIMNSPANDYVKTFFRGVDVGHVFSAKDIARRRPETLLHTAVGFGPRSALKVLDNEDRNYGYLIEKGQKFIGVVSVNSLQQALAEKKSIEHAILEKPTAVSADIPLNELISTVAQSPCAVPVIDNNSRYLGVISKGILLQALDKEAPNGQ
ncbi:glycine betaine/L-proline ABC transporter ATP-binding protein ProV [Xenorhabdus sp. TH1]|uniref:glycine betaine/L-proline ABC transporter ATP-binding protein ProV n=1 Tax=Xenorhabdus sp. TH1 TaxID=3130166 RepID=UPI0030D1C395